MLNKLDVFILGEARAKELDEEVRIMREKRRLERVKKVIELAKKRLELKEEVISLSNQDPRFPEKLKEALDILGL